MIIMIYEKQIGSWSGLAVETKHDIYLYVINDLNSLNKLL